MRPDLVAFQYWLRQRPGFERAAVQKASPVTGGASNLTLLVHLDGAPYRSVALRLQRPHGIFEPYDVVREARVVEALGPTAIPVPAVVGHEPSAAFLRAPFAVYQWVDAPHMGEAGNHASFAAYTATVAAIHRLDWRGAGLGFLLDDLGAIDAPSAIHAGINLVEARLRRFPGADNDLLRRGASILRATVPSDGKLALCQGDINVFNYLFLGGEVVAVVDWEAARISDPREDIGQLIALSHLQGLPFGPVRDAPFVQSYEMHTLEPLQDMEFFRARWLWELGVIYWGWMAYNDDEPWYAWDAIAVLLPNALDEVEAHARKRLE